MSEENVTPGAKDVPVEPTVPEPAVPSPAPAPVQVQNAAPVATTPAQPIKTSSGIRGIGQLLKDAWNVFTKAWAKYLLMLVTIVGVAIGTLIVVALLVLGGLALAKVSWILTVLIILVGVAIALYLFISIGLAMSKFIFSYAEGAPAGIGGSLKYAFQNSLSYLAVGILTGLIEFIPLLVVAAIVVILGIVIGFHAPTIIIGVTLLVASIIFMIYVGMMLTFVTQNFVTEGSRGLSAIKRSWHLVKGDFWRIFGRIFVIGLIGSVFSMLNFGYNKPIYVILSIIAIVLQTLYSFISSTATYFIYKDLVAKK